jgi:single-strand DNA-binding protein
MAARGVNKVILIGNLGADPEVRYMPSGGAVTTLRLATSETWKDQQSGQNQERTEWHRVVMFRRLAEIAGEYLKKGSKVYIEGSLRTRQWKAQDGADRYSTEIVANEMQMLDRAGAGGSNAGPSSPSDWDENPRVSERYEQPAFGKQSAGKAPSSAPPSDMEPEFDDDIPF